MAVVLTPRDIRDNHILTTLILKQMHEDSSLGAKIAPLKSVVSRRVKIAVRDFTPAGKGQFKARNANTPIRRGTGTLTETLTQLVDLEEMEPLDADDLIRLNSPDDRVSAAAARDIAQIGKELGMRNRNLTRWMRWSAFQDALTITFNDGTAVDVDYDLDNSDGSMSASHIVTASTAWDSEASADPITDMETWVDLIAADLSVDGKWFHVNKKTFRKMQKIDLWQNYMLDHYGPLAIPTAEMMAKVMNLEGGIVIENGYWEDIDGSINRYIPDGYALLTSDYVVDDAPIAQVYDGPVVLADGAGNLRVANNSGMQVEIFADPKSKTQYIRLSTARIPWIRREAFVWCKLYDA